MTTTHSNSDRVARGRAVVGRAGRTARRILGGVRAARPSAPGATSTTAALPSVPPAARLSPATALSENGFTVFRGLFAPDEVADLSRRFKAEAGIEPGRKYMRVDTANNFRTTREVVLEGRVVDAVRSALGAQPRFLQVGDLHYLHDTAGWHRDSVHRKTDASEAPDWRADGPRYGVVKAIVYMECDNAAMGLIAGSHATPLEIDRANVRSLEDAGRQYVIGPDTDPNLRLTPEQKARPLAWKAQPGDVLVFDERCYHAGRRVDDGAVSANREAPKFTLSMVFGLDNEHSERFFSYFRYVRSELRYRDLDPAFVAELATHDLVLDRGLTDFYADHPEDLVHVHLQGGLSLDEVRSRYAPA